MNMQRGGTSAERLHFFAKLELYLLLAAQTEPRLFERFLFHTIHIRLVITDPAPRHLTKCAVPFS
jgi:hypothetical protein